MSPEPASKNDKEKAVAFIVARLSSSRLPAKQLKDIGHKPILQWTLDHLRACQELDQIVIATVDETENLPLKDYSRLQNIPCFWYQGDVNHVTTRLRSAAEYYQADICLLISGDCPLVDPEAIDILVKTMRTNPQAETISIPEQAGQSCMLEGVHVARRKAWQRADDLAVTPELKEHQFPVIWLQPEHFTHLEVKLPTKFYAARHRLSVDTWADLEFMNAAYAQLQARQQDFNLVNALNLLEEDPELRKINQHVYQRQLVEKDRKILFVIDSGPEYGRGHLTRCIELARQFIERKGWQAEFLVDNQAARSYLTENGFRTLWGSFARLPQSNPADKPLDLKTAAEGCALIIVDIFDQRDAPQDWREELPQSLPVVSIGNAQFWAGAADMLIMPGTGTVPAYFLGRAQTGSFKVLSGLENLILRREIQKQGKLQKDLDLLVYLHAQGNRQTMEDFISSAGLNSIILTNFSDELPSLMARAKLFLGGFGISSYEALALGTYPVCWPHSPINERDARRFYEQLQLPPVIIKQANQLKDVVLPLLEKPLPDLPNIPGNCRNLVDEISQLLEPRK